jgi:AhpD family alkylhydroperoxidase
VTLPLPREQGALGAEYDDARAREGRVLAILRALGPRPEVPRAFLALADAILYGPASLGRREREVLAVATSEANGAGYSARVHTTLLAELGGERPEDRPLVEFARRLTLHPREAEAAVADLQRVLGDDQVYDAIAVVSLLNLANRAALATGITPADDLP